MTCRTCTHLGVPLNKLGMRVLRGGAYPCRAPEPPMPPLPVAVTGRRSFQWPMLRQWVVAGDGKDCPLHVKIAQPDGV